MRKIEQSTLDRLWAECREAGITGRDDGSPRDTMQTTPFDHANRAKQLHLYMLESLFTGLYTSQADVLLRAYVQAHGYIAALGASGHHQGAHYQDLLRELRGRVEDHFLRGGR